ncbi:MAG: peptide chain release factor N(5)-glutamine methyltransferase, partial [Ignavibacteriae bacterium]|nr:peptide chain release factor N(5)-glutamine methyltransferase [Ignavibacteriota bacterium]
MSEKKLTTLLEIINFSSKLLTENKIKDSRLNVELMFCDILNCDRIKLYLDFEKPLNPDEITRFKVMLKRRMKYEPLQYILGKTNFYGYQVKLDHRVLIPRQETEILVEKILEDILKSNKDNINILEIGTGSGCIAIALSGETNKKNVKHKIIAIDISDDSLEIAKTNAECNSILDGNIEFKVNDFLSNSWSEFNFDYVVSNPPYIPANDLDNLDFEIKNYEPIMALTDGKDGLLFYDKIFNLYNRRINNTKIYLEIGDGQRNKVEDLLKNYDIKNYSFFKDYCNI